MTPTARRQFHVLAKPTGPICNLDCKYCFFLSKEALYPGDRFRMTDDVLEAVHPPVLEVAACGRGQRSPGRVGSPRSWASDFFRRRWNCRAAARPGQQLHHTVQTNGTLLTDEWGESSPSTGSWWG